MTIEPVTPFATFTVSGTGPYALPWPYGLATIALAVIVEGQQVTLGSGTFTVDPSENAVSGNLFLTAATAATYAGSALVITRNTPKEQGWLGIQGAREAGLEKQLDRIVKVQQEQQSQIDTSIRGSTAMTPFLPEPGHLLIFDEFGQPVSGPTADQIASAQANAVIAQQVAALFLAVSPYRFTTFAELASRLRYTGATGAQINVAAGNRIDIPGIGVFEVLASGATIFDLNYTGVSSVKLKVVPNMGIWTPEAFGAKGDLYLSDGAANPSPTDDMPAFQLLFNAVFRAGGGTIKYGAKGYYLSQYTSTQVSTACHQPVTGTCKTLVVPPFDTRHVGPTEICMTGGASTGFGYSTSATWLSFPGELDTYQVTSANLAARSITLTTIGDAANFTVGQEVMLGRRGGNVAGLANTPSQEVAPVQFMTISTIVGAVISFADAWVHNFQAVSDLLEISKPRGLPRFPQNMTFDGLKFSRYLNTGVSQPYVLLSRTLKIYCTTLELDRVNMSFGMLQDFHVQDWILGKQASGVGPASVESCSLWRIDRITALHPNTSSLGPCWINDNCRQWSIGHWIACDQTTGFAALFGVDGHIDVVDLTNCGVSATYDGSFTAAFSVGMPLSGFYGTRQIAELNAYKLRNIGPSRITVGKMMLKGCGTVPIRFADVDLNITDVEIDCAAGARIFNAGNSGTRRADATYFPDGVKTRLTVGRARVTTANGLDPVFVLSDASAVPGILRSGDTVTTAPAASGDTTITVADGTLIRKGANLYYVHDGITGPMAGLRSVSGVVGNVVTLSGTIGGALPSGSPVWQNDQGQNQRVSAQILNLEVNGQRRPAFARPVTLFPDFVTGAGPYTDTLDFPVPSIGVWVLSVSHTSADGAHFEERRYRVTYLPDAAGPFQVQQITQISANKVRTQATVDGATIASGVVTVTVGANVSGKVNTVRASWSPDFS